MKSKNRIIAITLLLTIFLLCYWGLKHQKIGKSNHFYYWQTELNFTDNDCKTLEKWQVDTIFIRMFDLEWDSLNQDVKFNSPLLSVSGVDNRLHFIPVIFITNETMAKISSGQIDKLAQFLVRGCLNIFEQYKLSSFTEIQLDCDWSKTTRQNYFDLISAMRMVGRKTVAPDFTISSTIRLHQVKYRQTTGVPPADRGSIMVYGADLFTLPETKNSIFNRSLALDYLADLQDYPLPVDLALPVFHWLVQFDHYDQFIRLINTGGAELAGNDKLRHDGGNWYTALRDTMINGQRIMTGDRLRIDAASSPEVFSLAKELKKSIRGQQNLRIILFQYDNDQIAFFSGDNNEAISTLFSIF